MTTTPVLPALDSLPPMEVAPRLGRLRRSLPEAGVDALVVTGASNVRYLTGFTGSAGFLVVLPEDAVLVTDGRYATQSSEELARAGVEASVSVAAAPDQRRVAASLLGRIGSARIGLEADHVSWSAQRAWAAAVDSGRELVATAGLVEVLRRAKDAGELARIGTAAAVADAALAAVRSMLDTGPTEAEVALALDGEMRRLGAEDVAFRTIVAAGPNAARPHHRPTDRPVGRGEAVVIDFGSQVDGYRSDMTRTLWAGELADAQMQRAVEVVLASQAAGVEAVRAGAGGREVDGVCRDVIADAGWAEQFVHGTGHGVGLDIHEAPAVSAASVDTLADGHVVTVEPGVYLPGLGGVRIEDTVAVTTDGCRPLTMSPKDRP